MGELTLPACPARSVYSESAGTHLRDLIDFLNALALHQSLPILGFLAAPPRRSIRNSAVVQPGILFPSYHFDAAPVDKKRSRLVLET
jgi:hypothetical protein